MFFFALDCLKPGTSLSSEFFNSTLPSNTEIFYEDSVLLIENLTLKECQDMCIDFGGENPCKAVNYFASGRCFLFVTSPLTDLGVPIFPQPGDSEGSYIRKCL